MNEAQINHILKFTRKDKKGLNRMLSNFAKRQKFNQREHTYKYNGLEIYVTVYPGKHPTIELTTDYFPHTFCSDPNDIRYNKALNWKNIQGCWDNNQKMYNFVVNNLVNYDDKIGPQFAKFKKQHPHWNEPILSLLDQANTEPNDKQWFYYLNSVLILTLIELITTMISLT